jgi:hypothetical protein
MINANATPVSMVPTNHPPNCATIKEHMHHVSNSHVNISSSASQYKIVTFADTINAKEGQVPLGETRVGIDGSETWEGNRSAAKEGCVACPMSQSLQPGSGDSNYACLDQDWPCDVYHDEDSCLPCNPMIPPREYVSPLGRALPGHPEACALWEQMANSILKNPDLSFKATTHETAKDGENYWYNGVDTLQTQDNIRISCETYIDCLLQTHNWNAPGNHKSDCHDGVTSVQLLQGPVEGTKERSVLQETMGFSYQQVLGELIYGYVICCLDNGFAVTFLARFAATQLLDTTSPWSPRASIVGQPMTCCM